MPNMDPIRCFRKTKQQAKRLSLHYLGIYLNFSTLYLYFYLIVQTMPHDCAEEGHDYQFGDGFGVCKFCRDIVAPPGEI
jgi:hypothetical protein